MRRLIKDRKSGQLLGPDGVWLSDFASAVNFADIREVLAAKQKFKLSDVSLVIMMQDEPSNYDVSVPLCFDETLSNEARPDPQRSPSTYPASPPAPPP
jgi:hypothetical protein